MNTSERYEYLVLGGVAGVLGQWRKGAGAQGSFDAEARRGFDGAARRAQ